MLFINAISDYQQYLNIIERSAETIRSYTVELNCLNRFLEYRYNSPIYINELKLYDYEVYLSELKRKGASVASRRRIIYIIRSLYNYCIKKEMVNRNIGMLLEPIPLQQHEREYLTYKEFESLSNALNHYLIKVVVTCLFYTGLRINECLSLKVGDVDMENRVLSIRNTKSKKDRSIPIHPYLHDVLKAYKTTGRITNQNELFFITKKTGGLSANYVNMRIHEACHKLGWDRKITCHSLRHSFASNLVKKKVDIVKIQKLMGHSSLKVTGIYTHADNSELVEAVNLL